MFKLSNNLDLPELPAWHARSFWAMLLAAIATLANAAGINLFGFLGAVGVGTSADEVIATGERLVGAWQIVAPVLFGLWAYLERRAPSYRLVFWRRPQARKAKVVKPA